VAHPADARPGLLRNGAFAIVDHKPRTTTNPSYRPTPRHFHGKTPGTVSFSHSKARARESLKYLTFTPPRTARSFEQGKPDVERRYLMRLHVRQVVKDRCWARVLSAFATTLLTRLARLLAGPFLSANFAASPCLTCVCVIDFGYLSCPTHPVNPARVFFFSRFSLAFEPAL